MRYVMGPGLCSSLCCVMTPWGASQQTVLTGIFQSRVLVQMTGMARGLMIPPVTGFFFPAFTVNVSKDTDNRILKFCLTVN